MKKDKKQNKFVFVVLSFIFGIIGNENTDQKNNSSVAHKAVFKYQCFLIISKMSFLRNSQTKLLFYTSFRVLNKKFLKGN